MKTTAKCRKNDTRTSSKILKERENQVLNEFDQLNVTSCGS